MELSRFQQEMDKGTGSDKMEKIYQKLERLERQYEKALDDEEALA